MMPLLARYIEERTDRHRQATFTSRLRMPTATAENGIAYIESSEAALSTRAARLYIYLLACLRETGRIELRGEGIFLSCFPPLFG